MDGQQRGCSSGQGGLLCCGKPIWRLPRNHRWSGLGDWSTLCSRSKDLSGQRPADSHPPILPHVMADMHLITHTAFVADFETGGIVAQGESNPNAPQLCMRVSRNGGATFGNYRLKGLVSSGNYRSMMRWRGLGMGRDMVYELLWSYNGPSALQGAYVETVPHGA